MENLLVANANYVYPLFLQLVAFLFIIDIVIFTLISQDALLALGPTNVTYVMIKEGYIKGIIAVLVLGTI
jgi:hypothetical protein